MATEQGRQSEASVGPPLRSNISAYVARRIRDGREARAMTQDALAARLGVTQTCVSYWEAAKREPRLTDLMAVAVAVSQSLQFFLPPETPEGT